MIRGRVYRRTVTEAVIRGLATELDLRRSPVTTMVVMPATVTLTAEEPKPGEAHPRIHVTPDDVKRVAYEGRDALISIVSRECIALMRQGWALVDDDSRLPRRVVEPELARTILGNMEVGPHDEAHHVTSMADFLKHFGDPRRNGGPKGDGGDDR